MEKFITSIVSGTYEIIESGVFYFSDKSANIKFLIEDTTLEIEFIKKPEEVKNEDSLHLELKSDKHLLMSCINWPDFSSGRAISEPFPILMDDEKGTIYIKFGVYNLGSIPHMIYTFYRQVKAIQDEQDSISA